MLQIPQPARQYDTLTDTVPELWQFIVALRSDDLVSEMIQNEIDAGSTRTILSFEEGRLVCSGNGTSVDTDGWTRLRYLKGAGDLAPRKRSLIGVKNHGLKACFAIGDDIYIRSDGQCTHQTLYKNGHRKLPRPGATTRPFADPSAPTGRGTTVEVTYRRRPIVVRQGEPLTLAACTPEIIASLFKSAITGIPERFIGVLRPDHRQEYVIELRHCHLGSVRFSFRAGRTIRKGALTTFLRSCEASSDNPAFVLTPVRERAVLGICSRPGRQSREVADFYRGGKRLFVEVAWREDAAGRLLPEHGRLRYPIAYTGAGPASSNGLGVHYSAPFVSDPERHGLAEGASDWNIPLIQACDRLLVAAVKKILIPRVGARALDVLVDASSLCADRTKDLVAMCVAARALPVTPPRKSGADRGGSWRRCVVPCFAANSERVAPELVAIAPAPDWLLAPAVHPTIVGLLASRQLPGYGTDHIVFDEHAALRRLWPVAASVSFPWPNEAMRARTLADPKIVSQHLDAIGKALRMVPNGPAAKARIDALARSRAELPDENGKLWPAKDLKLAAPVPRDLPYLTLPPLLHSKLAKHPVFKMPGWDLGEFGFDEFLETLASDGISSQTATFLFRWICANPLKVPTKAWPKIRELPIWPEAGTGAPCVLDVLCLPRNQSIAGVLGPALKRPSKSVLKLAATVRKRGLSLTFRSWPTTYEIGTWLSPRLAAFARDRVLTESERAFFRALEADLAVLVAEPHSAEALAPFAGDIPALSKAGYLRNPADLVDNRKFAALDLQNEDLLDRGGSALDLLLPAADRPTAAMVEAALRADLQNTIALIPRLKALANLSGGDRHADLGIADVPCIPVHGIFCAAGTLAFKGNEGNFWGEWRREITGKNLSQADQALYKRAGVLSAEPRAESSKAFFAWLSKNAPLVEKHLPQILRHFAYDRGVQAWWATDEALPCLPAYGPGGLSLLSYHDATSKSAPCYVDDFHELGDAIRQAGMKILLAVDKHQDVRRPITEVLVAAQVKSLRLSADKPSAVTGDNPREAPEWAMDVLSQFCSEKMAAGLQKRIVTLGISSRLMTVRWYRNLQAVKRIVRAESVTAVYRLGRHRVSATVRQAFDGSTGSLWLAERGDEEDMEDAFFEALADRVFIQGAPPYCAPALEKTLKVEVKEAQRASAAPAPSPDDAETDENDDAVGEAPEAHYDWQPNPARNVPSPGPLSGNSAQARKPTGRGVKRASKRPVVPDELEQKQHLKEQHYAWHCQIGLARQPPSALAPKRSYVEHQENRQRLIEAHHPDAVDAGGARHAGNMLILSYLAHHQYGRHISRGQVTDALRAGERPRQVKFGSGKFSKVIDGVVVEIVLPATGEVVPIFFTNWHAKYWLSKADTSSIDREITLREVASATPLAEPLAGAETRPKTELGLAVAD